MERDPIDRLIDTWRQQRPDLELESMELLARLNHAAAQARRRVDAFFAANGLSAGEFDVLSALRRQGEPYRLKPSELARHVMMSPSGMTTRIDHMVEAGHVVRVSDPDNGRIAPVELTATGLETIDAVVGEYAAALQAIVAPLSDRQRRALDGALRALAEAASSDAMEA